MWTEERIADASAFPKWSRSKCGRGNGGGGVGNGNGRKCGRIEQIDVINID